MKATVFFGAMALLVVAGIVTTLYGTGEIGGYDEDKFPPPKKAVVTTYLIGENLKVKMADVDIDNDCQYEKVENRVWKIYTTGKDCQISFYGGRPLKVLNIALLSDGRQAIDFQKKN